MNNKEIGRIIANLENDDLRKLGVGNGKCGFYFEFPDELSNIDLSKINVLPNNCNTPLPFIHNSKLIFDDTLNMSNLPVELIFKASQLDNLFIVNHIPKTAGTSLRNAFGKILLDKNILYHYNNVAVCSPEIWNWKFASNQTVKDNDLISLIIEKPINLIMGHFGFPEQNGFDKFISIFPCAKSIVFLRNPKDHICSLYHFSCKYFGENKSFKDFIMQSHVINYQTTALCGIGIDQLSFVGLVECFAESLKLLNYKYNLAIDTLSLNKGDDDRFEGYNYGQFGDENVWLNFEELNQLDYLLYEKAKERFDQEKKDFLFER